MISDAGSRAAVISSTASASGYRKLVPNGINQHQRKLVHLLPLVSEIIDTGEVNWVPAVDAEGTESTSTHKCNVTSATETEQNIRTETPLEMFWFAPRCTMFGRQKDCVWCVSKEDR